jgi:hypothetical protein
MKSILIFRPTKRIMSSLISLLMLNVINELKYENENKKKSQKGLKRDRENGEKFESNNAQIN